MRLLEEFKSTVKEETDYSKFDALVRAGLANKAQLQRLHKILEKMKEDKPTFTNADRMIIQNLFNKMVNLLSSDKQIFQRARQTVSEELITEVKKDDDEDPPYVLILKRKQIRMFSNRTKVALYYNQKLDKYFTVPYGGGISGGTIQAEEVNSAIVQLNKIMEKPMGVVEHTDGSKTKVDNFTARIILEMYDVVSEENQKNIAKMLSESSDSFNKISQFAYEKLE
jgi:hypothetical protein